MFKIMFTLFISVLLTSLSIKEFMSKFYYFRMLQKSLKRVAL